MIERYRKILAQSDDLIIHGLRNQFWRLFDALFPAQADYRWPSEHVNLVRAECILTGLPDDRKNFFSFGSDDEDYGTEGKDRNKRKQAGKLSIVTCVTWAAADFLSKPELLRNSED